ncbi:UDP-sugar transporter protein SLC35A5-like [Saccoglossus kowalevskii]|uniref:Probable UDP-sugar transporter protein SLC35A5-like n=1 Tax=Saccoglossus kowalevskii TaxID=10224 RepID=A0ABM0M4C2_SACKO|nr:PREDICTED: probable UDP-sugar transporter protein SLC35A5-like [Saccoglossus kowalevskii]
MNCCSDTLKRLRACVCDQTAWVTLLLGGLYVSLAASRIMMTRISENEDGLYNYLPVTVNVCAEMVKLVFSSVLAFKYFYQAGHSFREVFCLTTKDLLSLMRWAIPGLLYFVDNLITFYTIAYFEPAMVVLMSNFVIITTSILFRVVLKRKLSSVQWVAVIILFLALVTLSSRVDDYHTHMNQHKDHAIDPAVTTVKPVNQDDACNIQILKTSSAKNSVLKDENKNEGGEADSFILNQGHILVITQCLIASMANIYNEKIFKEGKGMEESIYVQNSKLYMFGVIFNSLSLVIHDNYRTRLLQCGFFYGYNVYSIILIFITATLGLTIATILKFRDNMFHIMSSSTTTVTVITLSVAFLNFQPSLEFYLQAPIVLLSIYVFNATKLEEEVGKLSPRRKNFSHTSANGKINRPELQQLIESNESEEAESSF